MRSAIAVFALSLRSWPRKRLPRNATQPNPSAKPFVQHLTKLGYKQISDVDVVKGRFEVNARSKAGADIDLVLDMKTLNVIRKNPS